MVIIPKCKKEQSLTMVAAQTECATDTSCGRSSRGRRNASCTEQRVTKRSSSVTAP